jgi:hypothetical protein
LKVIPKRKVKWTPPSMTHQLIGDISKTILEIGPIEHIEVSEDELRQLRSENSLFLSKTLPQTFACYPIVVGK